MQRRPRKRNERALEAVRQMPCCICGDDTSVEAHHPRVGLFALGMKNDDEAAVPLCGRHHRELHAMGNEREFWASYGMTR
jgi:hypothetical protein